MLRHVTLITKPNPNLKPILTPIWYTSQPWFQSDSHLIVAVEFTTWSTATSTACVWICYPNFANPIRIQYRFHEITFNTLSFSRIISQSILFCFRQFTMFLANSLWIHNCFANSLWMLYFVGNSLLIRYLSRGSLSFSRIYFESTFFFANSFYINKLYREFGLNQLSLSLVSFESTISFANLPRKHNLPCDFTMNPL